MPHGDVGHTCAATTLLTGFINNPETRSVNPAAVRSERVLVRRLHVDLMRLPSACCPRCS
jgi:hypothetical protein